MDVRTDKISIDAVSKQFIAASGHKVEALRDVSLSIGENEFVCVVGRSGCGKSTLLNMVAGFLKPSSGSILVDGKQIEGPGKGKGVVFQNLALFPWLTARKNIEFGCKQKGMSESERNQLSTELIDLVHLNGFEDKYPFELSGGMQQRVAIARALAIDPIILLMDEPFGALDEQTRMVMQTELLQIWSSRKKTVVFITHSVSESIVLADRIIVLGTNPGHLKREFKVTLERPRDRLSVDFVKLEAEVQDALD
ncbi:MAG: nitrate ABC transporter ATP-binding protein [marine bacterium B5-7]|nr:MAG: nitrate ABC transporter ATP-binding protein [marine bacterium B5-7]